MRKIQVDLTETKHDEMSLYGQCMLSKTNEGGQTNITFLREGRDFDIGLPSVSKCLNEDLGGMTENSEWDRNMI